MRSTPALVGLLAVTACARSDIWTLEPYVPADSDPADSDWYDPAWSYRKVITVQAAAVDEDLTGFVLLVSLTDADLADHARADGGDLRFVAPSDLSVLPHEIEGYDSGVLVAWVRVPSISASEDTVVALYYGNPVATATSDGEVFDATYRAVWHMSDTPTVDPHARDATANHNHGSFQGSMVASDRVPGVTGDCLDFDGVDDALRVTDADSLSFSDGSVDSPVTISAWVYMRDAAGFKIVTKGLCCTGPEYFLRTGDQTDDLLWIRFYQDIANFIGRQFSTPMNAGEWLHIATTYDGSSSSGGIRLYVNGTRVDDVDVSNGNHTTMRVTTEDLYIGMYESGAAYHADGLIDELRLLAVERTAAWIRAEARNQSDPRSFYTVSAEQRRP